MLTNKHFYTTTQTKTKKKTFWTKNWNQNGRNKEIFISNPMCSVMSSASTEMTSSGKSGNNTPSLSPQHTTNSSCSSQPGPSPSPVLNNNNNSASSSQNQPSSAILKFHNTFPDSSPQFGIRNNSNGIQMPAVVGPQINHGGGNK